jgi:catechol-2,3-dioxygenase
VRILKATLTVAQPDEAAAFYRDVLELPVAVHDGRVTIGIGFSSLVLEQGDDFDGVHHLAFGIAPADFELARIWLRERAEPILVDGSDVIDGPDGWNSRSLYFLGPEATLLELIARDADAHVPATQGQVPPVLSLSEVGIGVPDVAQAVRTLEQDLGLPAFPPQGTQFAPVGSHDGLIILVDQDRIWFPTETQQAARGPVTVELEAPRAGRQSLRKSATILASH